VTSVTDPEISAFLSEGTRTGILGYASASGRVLRKPGFTWADHGEALLRRRKPWYYEHEPRPGVSVIGARLQELTALR
jgi:hypothetical protein